MPENPALDLRVEDIRQPSWDELTRSMLNGDPEDEPDVESCSDSSSTTSATGADSGTGGTNDT